MPTNSAATRAELYAHIEKYVPNLLAFINRHIREIDANGCWIWDGKPTGRRPGHGRVSIGPRDDLLIIYANRFSFMIYHGDLGDDQALHRCSNTLCFNPEHLFRGDAAAKVNHCVAAGRHRNQNTGRTHCRNGHPLTGDNVRLEGGRFRRCLACQHNRRKDARA